MVRPKDVARSSASASQRQNSGLAFLVSSLNDAERACAVKASIAGMISFIVVIVLGWQCKGLEIEINEGRLKHAGTSVTIL